MKSNKNNKKCLICGKSYAFCSNCSGKDSAWKITFCSENCLSLYEIVTGLRDGKYTEEEAYSKIEECDTTSLSSELFNSGVKESIEKILKSQESPVIDKVKEIIEKMDTPIDATNNNEIVENEAVVEEPVSNDNESANFKKEKNNYVKYNKNFHNKK